jgi:hypothetical protein
MRGGFSAQGRAAGSAKASTTKRSYWPFALHSRAISWLECARQSRKYEAAEAIQLDNIFPGVQNVELRKGSTDWKTAAPATVHSLLPYTGLTVNKLFAATNAGIYDVTTAGAFGGSVVGLHERFLEVANDSDIGG